MPVDTQALLKTGNALMKGVNADAIHIRARQLDKILNGAIIPALALQGAMIGACIVLFKANDKANLGIVFSVIAAYLAAIAARSLHHPTGRDTGYLGAFAAFVTAAVVTFDLSKQATGMAIAAPYLLIAALSLRDSVWVKELIFAPFYTALLIGLSIAFLQDAAALYFAVFLIGVVTLYRLNKITLSYGLFAGMLLALAGQILYTNTSRTSLAIISAITIVALGAYTLRAVEPFNSNLRNFLSQSLAALLILPMIMVLTDRPHPYWLWPLVAAAFYGTIYQIGRTSVKPTAISWIVLSAIGAIWLTHKYGPVADVFGPSNRFGDRLPALATIVLSVVLYVAGYTIQNRFVCNVARILMLISGAIGLNIANQTSSAFLSFLNTPDVSGLPANILVWRDFSFVTAFLLSLLPALAIATTLSEPPPVKTTSWWRGMVKPRHAVVFRSIYRASVTWLDGVPILGGLIKMLNNGVNGLRYLKTSGDPINFTDSTVLIALILFAFAEISLTTAGLHWVNTSADWHWLAETAAWTSCAVFSYALGLVHRQTLFTFIGVAFALVPFVRFVERSFTLNIGIIVLTASLTLVFCSMLRRYVDPKL